VNFQYTYALFKQTKTVPAQREYRHDWASAGTTHPWPKEAYWPVSLDYLPWKIDDALQRMHHYHGSTQGTLGFLLEEEGGAPGFGLILRRATALGYRWHIATVMLVQARGAMAQDPDRPLGSIFVGPFLFGEWPSREFDVLLTMVPENGQKQDIALRTQWLTQQNMVLQESWALPSNRVGRIYVREKQIEEIE
jgi:hypothetical protein